MRCSPKRLRRPRKKNASAQRTKTKALPPATNMTPKMKAARHWPKIWPRTGSRKSTPRTRTMSPPSKMARRTTTTAMTTTTMTIPTMPTTTTVRIPARTVNAAEAAADAAVRARAIKAMAQAAAAAVAAAVPSRSTKCVPSAWRCAAVTRSRTSSSAVRCCWCRWSRKNAATRAQR
jgi:hypothetical protein